MAALLAGVATATAVIAWGRVRPATRLRTVAPASSTASGEVMGSVVPLVVFAMGVVLAGVPAIIVVAAAIAVWLGERLRRRRRASRERVARAAATIELTFGLADELRAGRTPDQALAAVAAMSGPLQQALNNAASAAAVGADPAAELARAAGLPGAEQLASVGAAWSVAASAGGRVAVVLERLGRAMDDDQDLRRELEAAMAGPRATMALLALLPVLGLALGEGIGADPIGLLVHRPVGWALLAGAAGLDLAGVWLTHSIARAALRA
jgi:tight adherence protein B